MFSKMATKTVLVLLMLIVCCYCLDNDKNTLQDESRAKKRKTALRILGAFLILILSKMAISKLIFGFLFWLVFQKVVYFAGILLNIYMKKKMTPQPAPSMEYGINNDYNTVGYSYGPPDSYAVPDHLGTGQNEGSSYGAPAPLNEWPYNRRKHVK